jgi:hypothetical protein
MARMARIPTQRVISIRIPALCADGLKEIGVQR